MSFPLPDVTVAHYLIGRGGATIKALKRECECNIWIEPPNAGQEVHIEASSPHHARKVEDYIRRLIAGRPPASNRDECKAFRIFALPFPQTATGSSDCAGISVSATEVEGAVKFMRINADVEFNKEQDLVSPKPPLPDSDSAFISKKPQNVDYWCEGMAIGVYEVLRKTLEVRRLYWPSIK